MVGGGILRPRPDGLEVVGLRDEAGQELVDGRLHVGFEHLHAQRDGPAAVGGARELAHQDSLLERVRGGVGVDLAEQDHVGGAERLADGVGCERRAAAREQRGLGREREQDRRAGHGNEFHLFGAGKGCQVLYFPPL